LEQATMIVHRLNGAAADPTSGISEDGNGSTRTMNAGLRRLPRYSCGPWELFTHFLASVKVDNAVAYM
jgi:hypothetical protein